MGTHQNLRAAEKANIKTSFSVRKILFADGSSQEFSSN